MPFPRRKAGAVALAAGLLSCGPEIPSVQREEVVLAVYDPSKANLPTPNDLAMEGGKVAISENPELSAAENELKLSFNGADGFSTGSSARAQFTSALSAASISDKTVLAIDLGENGKGAPTPFAVRRDYADCDSSISLVAPAGYARGHVYLFAVRGGESGLEGAGGEPVVAAPAFHFLRAGVDLTAHPDAFPGTREEKQAKAKALEAVRQKLEPYFRVLEAQGLPRREVAALWTFTAVTGGEAYFDPGSKRIPFPNDLLKDPSTGLVSLPIDPSEKPESQALKRGFNQLDGFSLTAALAIDASEALDRTSVGAASVRVFRRDTLEQVAATVSLSSDGGKIVVQPTSPLRPATAYVVVAGKVSDVQGNPLGAMPLASLLKLKNPLLTAGGQSTISSVCAGSAARLEPLRAAMAPVLDKLESLPEPERLGRAQIAAAYTFTTQDIAKRARELWSAPYSANLPLTVQGVQSAGAPLTMPDVSKLLTGQLSTVDFLEPTSRAFRDKGQPRQIEFVLSVPKGVSAGSSLPVVVFGHGLNTERRLSFFVANRLAKAGFATMAIDFPYHGERTACLADSHCSWGATCATDGTCLKNGQPAELARSLNLWPVGKGTPSATGVAFVDVENLVGSRDHFRQAFVDLSAQVRLIREMDWKLVTGGYGLDGDRLMYVGISLGGIIGGGESGVDPHFKSMLLNVAGAGLVDLMRESNVFGPLLKQGLSAKGIQEGSPEYDSFVNAARWVLDEVDPINLAQFASREPLRWTDPKTGQANTAAPKRLRLQMASGDMVVPNSSTLRLLTASGIDKATQFRSFLGSHGFLADPAEPAYYPGQDDMASFLEGK
ncbi:MAG: Ig-like domain-containing protein [Myxococcales bacterium]|nr:Ig-like domain-containing protein [Myxococcales bacterium]